MKRILLVLIAAAVVFLTYEYLRVKLASDETLIRWRIEGMVEGFNEARLAPCVKGIAEDWRDGRDSRIDRALLTDVLRSIFFHEKDRETKRFRYRVEIEEGLAIDHGPEDDRVAAVDLVARFDILSKGEWSPTWRVGIAAEMKEHPEEGWQVHGTRRETLWSDGRLMSATRR